MILLHFFVGEASEFSLSVVTNLQQRVTESSRGISHTVGDHCRCFTKTDWVLCLYKTHSRRDDSVPLTSLSPPAATGSRLPINCAYTRGALVTAWCRAPTHQRRGKQRVGILLMFPCFLLFCCGELRCLPLFQIYLHWSNSFVSFFPHLFLYSAGLPMGPKVLSEKFSAGLVLILNIT